MGPGAVGLPRRGGPDGVAGAQHAGRLGSPAARQGPDMPRGSDGLLGPTALKAGRPGGGTRPHTRPLWEENGDQQRKHRGRRRSPSAAHALRGHETHRHTRD